MAEDIIYFLNDFLILTLEPGYVSYACKHH